MHTVSQIRRKIESDVLHLMQKYSFNKIELTPELEVDLAELSEKILFLS